MPSPPPPLSSPQTLRTIALSVFNRNVTELSFRFRLWVMHIGDVDPNDTSHFPSPMLVPALIALCSGKVRPGARGLLGRGGCGGDAGAFEGGAREVRVRQCEGDWARAGVRLPRLPLGLRAREGYRL